MSAKLSRVARKILDAVPSSTRGQVVATARTLLQRADARVALHDARPSHSSAPDVFGIRRDVAARYLKGSGIEIGALHHPLQVPKEVAVKYVDRVSTQDLRRGYTGMEDSTFTPVDIIDDGEQLATLGAESQDFIIANHLFEHCQDPIATLGNWLRVLRWDGILFLAVPDKRYTFDRDRPVTPLAHILRDHAEGPAWSLRSHQEEWTRLVDKVPEDRVEAHIRYLVESDYSIHFHVWTAQEPLEIFLHCQRVLGMPLELLCMQQSLPPDNLYVLRKSKP